MAAQVSSLSAQKNNAYMLPGRRKCLMSPNACSRCHEVDQALAVRILRIIFQKHTYAMQLQTGQAGLLSRREVDRIHRHYEIILELLRATPIRTADAAPTTAASVTSVIAGIVASLSEVSVSAGASYRPNDLHEAGLGVMQLLHAGVQYIDDLSNPDAQDHQRRQQQADILRKAYSNCCADMWLRYLVSLDTFQQT